jgi:photosystem II stability/assembly factor-like uncharacterized protein
MATTFASQGYGNFFSLAADPLNSGTVYVGSTRGYGVVKTTDGGASWKSFGVGAVNVKSVTVDPHNSGTLYAVSDFPQSIFKTTDGGMNWAVSSRFQRTASLVIDPRDSNTLYAVSGLGIGTGTGVEKSTDGGATWNDVGHASFAAEAPRFGLGGFSFAGPLILDPRNPDTLYVAAVGDCCRTAIFQSTDGGIHWSMPATLAGNYAEFLVMDPQNSATLYAGGSYRSTVSKSTDGGVTWSDSALPPEASPAGDDDFWTTVRWLAVDPQDSNVVYATGSGGIFKSVDGGATWTNMNSGLAPYVCGESNACPGEPYFVGYPGEPYFVGSLAIDPRMGTLYAASRSGVLRSNDGGSSWSPVVGGLPAAPAANSLMLDPNDPSRLFAAGGAGVSTITLGP